MHSDFRSLYFENLENRLTKLFLTIIVFSYIKVQDMYLLSFLKINAFFQGTTKPTYYVKLYDDNNLTSDQEQGIGQKIMI